MVVESNKIEKICAFYVSDFHLEMILLPYIKNKIEKNEQITIITDRNLEKTINELIKKVNFSEEIKEKILKINWNSKNVEKIEENSNIIIIGKKNFLNEIHIKIEKENLNKIKIIDCYKFDDIKYEMNEIISKYNINLNTLGTNYINN